VRGEDARLPRIATGPLQRPGDTSEQRLYPRPCLPCISLEPLLRHGRLSLQQRVLQ